MKKLVAFASLSLFLNMTIQAQDKSAVMMSIGDEKVTLGEFESIFKKNNSNNAVTKEALDEYLDLYTIFKLKIKSAYEEKLDTNPAFIKEFATYTRQLSSPHLTDKKYEKAMIDETIKRLKTERKVAHILVRLPKCPLPADTLAAYKKAMDIYKEVTKNGNFEEAAKKHSQDSATAVNNGMLGYFSALSLAYPFETAMYNTKVNGISQPVRTSFGYHVVKVYDERPSSGKRKIAHIYIYAPEANKDGRKDAENKINEVYTQLQNGGNFVDLVRTYSDDHNSTERGGELPPFGINEMIPEYEAAAFSLKPGEYSKPFATNYGLHIIKLIDIIAPPADDKAAEDLARILPDNPRWQNVKNANIDQFKKKYGFVLNKKFITALEAEAVKNNTNFSQEFLKNNENTELFKIGNESVAVKELTEFARSKMALNNSINYCTFEKEVMLPFISQKVTDYRESQLPNEDPQYKALQREYKEGILLFNLMDNKIWSRSLKDTTGLENFYQANKNNYTWKDGERVKTYLIDCKDAKAEKAARKLAPQLLNGTITAEQFENALNKKVKDNVFAIEGIYTKNNAPEIVKNTQFKIGVGQTEIKDGKPRFVIVQSELPSSIKELKEAKGLIISDYQTYLENEWVKQLKASYPVSVDKNIMYQLISK